MKRIVFFAFALSFQVAAMAQNWSTVGGNNQRNGLSKITGPSAVTQPFWTISAASTVFGNAIFTFGDRFVTSRTTTSPVYTSKIECRSLTDGALIWEQQVRPGAILYAIGFNEDGVYAHDYDADTLYALSPDDGSVKWAVREQNFFGGNTGVLFAENGDIIIRGKRLNKNTGQTVWTYNYLVPVLPNPGFAASRTTYYHYSGAFGTPIRLFALDLQTGQFKYQTNPLPGAGDQEWPVMVGADGTIYLKRDGGNLYAFQDTGNDLQIKWEYAPTGAEMPGQFGTDKNGNIYVVDSDTVKLLSRIDGRVLARSTERIGAQSFLNISVDAEGKVYINNSSNKMLCFSSDLQTKFWELTIPSLTYCGPALAKDGILVVGGSGTTLRAFKASGNYAPVADFRASEREIQAGGAIWFYDQSSYQPTSWQWFFQGGTPATSTAQNPENVRFNAPGLYEVRLVVSNAFGRDTLVKRDYIRVTPSLNVSDPSKAPSRFELRQNYPNPFNPTTTIAYQLPTASVVSLKVYDMLGKEVATLVNGRREAGTHVVSFNGANLSSGVYFYRLQANGFAETKKMTLVK